jgi:hypothetical protein
MFVLRLITTTNMPAHEAQSQMNPFFAALQALFTALRFRRDDWELFKMGASCHA